MKKSPIYFLEPRKEIIQLIPDYGITHLLDIGCGAGNVGSLIKKSRSIEIVGIEKNEKAAALAKQNLDFVLVGDAEVINIPFEKGYFDCIILADILEHFHDPRKFLIRIKKFLSVNGVLIISVPNIRHYTVIRDLLFNKWRYKDRGIMDETHLRFFTKKSLTLLTKECGYVITGENSNFRLLEKGFSRRLEKWLAYIFSVYLFREFFMYQVIIRLSPCPD